MHKAIAAVVGSLMLGSAADAATIDVDNFLVGTDGPGTFGVGAMSAVSPSNTTNSVALQTWTVGRTGRLDQIDFFNNVSQAWSEDGASIVKGPDFYVTMTVLRGGTVNLPGTIELGSITKAASEIGFSSVTTSFDFSGLGIFASAGEVLTLRMAVETCPEIYHCARIWGSTHTLNEGNTNSYAGGAAFVVGNDGAIWRSPWDMNFRTWTSAVPEPSTWAMMIVGFGAVGSMVRTSRRRNAVSAA